MPNSVQQMLVREALNQRLELFVDVLEFVLELLNVFELLVDVLEFLVDVLLLLVDVLELLVEVLELPFEEVVRAQPLALCLAACLRGEAPLRRASFFFSSVLKTIGKTSSKCATGISSSFSSTYSGISCKSFSLPRGNKTVLIPARSAASTFSFNPPMARTRPRRVISPVIAMLPTTGRFDTAEMSAVQSATPAEGPSFGMAPSGKWMCKSRESRKPGSMPSISACERM